MQHYLFAALLCVILFGCSSNSDKEEQAAKLPDIEQNVRFKRIWSASIGDSFDKRFSNIQPGVSATHVYLANVEGGVSAHESERGKRVWRTKIDLDISAGVGHASGRVFVGTFAGKLVALDADTGEELWRSSVTSEILSVPAANADVVVAQTIDGRLFGFASETGKQLWRYDHTVPSLTLRSTASPVIYRDRLYTAFGNGQLVCLDLSDGSLAWDARVSQPKGRNELEKIVDIDGSPVIDAAFIYAASNNGAVASFALTQGRPLWKQDLSSFLPVALGVGRVFAVSNNSDIVAYNAVNGDIDWVNEQLHLRDLGAPAAFKNYVLAIDSDDYLHILNQSDGELVGRFKPSGDDFIAPIKVEGDQFYVLSGDGNLSVYRAQTN